MNNTLLARCLLELDKTEPRLDYVRGILETLIEVEGFKPTQILTRDQAAAVTLASAFVPEQPKTEGQILDEITKARLAGVKQASNVEVA